MKYIDADKIRTEIKRLKAENNCGTDEFIAAKDIAYDKVFDFLETLEEPVTDCHDLEEKKTFDDYLKVCPSGRRKINVAEILEEEREMKIWHEIAKEYPPIGETVCILWNDGIITTDVWDEEDSISPWMKYWCLSSDICLPKE